MTVPLRRRRVLTWPQAWLITACLSPLAVAVGLGAAWWVDLPSAPPTVEQAAGVAPTAPEPVYDPFTAPTTAAAARAAAVSAPIVVTRTVIVHAAPMTPAAPTAGPPTLALATRPTSRTTPPTPTPTASASASPSGSGSTTPSPTLQPSGAGGGG